VVVLDLRNESVHTSKHQQSSGMGQSQAAPPQLVSLPIFAQHNFTNLLCKVTFNPKDDLLLCTTGAMEFKVWRLVDGVFKSAQPFAKSIPSGRTYTEHLWIDRN